MDDVISRRAVLAICEKKYWNGADDYDPISAIGIAKEVKKLPSAQQWIPCSKRLPEEGETVVLQFRHKNSNFFRVTCRIDFNLWVGIGRDIQPVAWMPLQPYKGDE